MIALETRRSLPEIRKLERQLYVHVGANFAGFDEFLGVILEDQETEVQVFDQPAQERRFSLVRTCKLRSYSRVDAHHGVSDVVETLLAEVPLHFLRRRKVRGH